MKSRDLIFFLILPGMACLAPAQSARDPAILFELNRNALPAAHHLVVNVELQVGEKEYLRFRCDRTPELVRIHFQGGDTFVTTKDKPWLRSQDWGYSGTVVTEILSTKLNQYRAYIDAPFHESASRDASQGAKVWKSLSETTEGDETLIAFERTREHPRAGGQYPIYTYSLGTQNPIPIIRRFSAQFRDDKGKQIPAEIDYHVLTTEQSTAVRQRDLMREVQSIKARMALLPLSVDGKFISVKTLKIKGLVHGVNSDLTFTSEDGTSQRIIVHDGLCWTSNDNGKTWGKEDKPDRSYARMIFSPLLYNGRDDMGSPGIRMEEVERQETKEGAEQHARIAPLPGQKQSDVTQQLWIARRVNDEPIIRRVRTPMLMMGRSNNVEADYSCDPSAAVHPPEGAKLRLPKLIGDTKPEALLHKAKRMMSGQPRWKVSAKIDDKTDSRISGIVEEGNSDLQISAKDTAPIHQIIAGEAQYLSLNGDKTWTQEKINRDWYHVVNTPKRFSEGEKIPPFDIIEQQWLDDGGAVIHIRFQSPQATDDGADRSNYWLEARPDASVWVKRYLGPMGYQGHYIYGSVDYERPGKGSKPVQAPRMGRSK